MSEPNDTQASTDSKTEPASEGVSACSALFDDMPVVMKASEVDYKLAEILGEPVHRFLLLTFDGVVFKYFGTPKDNEKGRKQMAYLVQELQDPHEWEKFRSNWLGQIGAHAGLSSWEEIMNYKPKLGIACSRTVTAYSECDHAAVELLEKAGAQSWTLDFREKRFTLKVGKRDFQGESFSKVASNAALFFLSNVPAHPIRPTQRASD